MPKPIYAPSLMELFKMLEGEIPKYEAKRFIERIYNKVWQPNLQRASGIASQLANYRFIASELDLNPRDLRIKQIKEDPWKDIDSNLKEQPTKRLIKSLIKQDGSRR